MLLVNRPITTTALYYLLIFTLSDKIILLTTILKTSCPLSQAPTRRTMSQGSYTDFVAFSGLRCADVFDFFQIVHIGSNPIEQHLSVTNAHTTTELTHRHL